MNEKYLAGFIDADGHISVRARKGAKPDLEVSAAQRARYRDILDYAQTEFGGCIRERFDGKYLELQMRCGPARKCLERLKKYMVIKGHQAEALIALVDGSPVLKTDEEVKSVRARVKQIRATPRETLPNFPSRKWLAGYFDGDGSFTAKVAKDGGYGYPRASILASPNYRAGIDLIYKCLGGSISKSGNNFTWQISLSQPSKAIQFLEYFAKHLSIKKPQAYYLLGCAKSGNFRNGDLIREHLMSLNAQQHRLSDPASYAADLVRQVDFDIEKKPCNWIGRDRKKRQSNLQNV